MIFLAQLLHVCIFSFANTLLLTYLLYLPISIRYFFTKLVISVSYDSSHIFIHLRIPNFTLFTVFCLVIVYLTCHISFIGQFTHFYSFVNTYIFHSFVNTNIFTHLWIPTIFTHLWIPRFFLLICEYLDFCLLICEYLHFYSFVNIYIFTHLWISTFLLTCEYLR